jgi:parvulin-like peptidyl-prolyl isomerase
VRPSFVPKGLLLPSRIRLLVLAVVTAVIAAACGGASLPSDVAATVNGDDIPLDLFERISAAKAEGLGLEGEDYDEVQAAVDAGLIDRQALAGAIQQAAPQAPSELTDDLVDAARETYVAAVGEETIAAGRDELGLDDGAWQELFATAARAEFQALLANIGPQVPLERGDQVDAAQRQALSLLIQVAIVDQVFEEQDAELAEDAVQEQFDAELERAGGDAEQLAGQLAGTGLDVDDYRDIILTTIAKQNAIVSSFSDVDPDELQEQYEAGIASGEFVTADVSHILISPEAAEGEEPDEAAFAEAEQQAEDLIDELAGGADFAELAREFSDDPGSGAQGGALGEAPLGGYVPPFRDAALEAPLGEIVGPVRSDFGYHIIRVDDRTELAFEDVEQQLTQNAAPESAAEASTLIQEAFSDADVEVAERFGVWDPTAAAVVTEDELTSTDDAVPPVETVPPTGG